MSAPANTRPRTDPPRSIITHDDGTADRGMRVCRCGRCGVEALCTPRFDFYTVPSRPDGALYCEECMWSVARTLHRCSCGRAFTEPEWNRLPIANSGYQADDAEILEMRNCTSCNSTRCVVIWRAPGSP